MKKSGRSKPGGEKLLERVSFQMTEESFSRFNDNLIFVPLLALWNFWVLVADLEMRAVSQIQ
jgi:hypothetical protein